MLPCEPLLGARCSVYAGADWPRTWPRTIGRCFACIMNLGERARKSAAAARVAGLQCRRDGRSRTRHHRPRALDDSSEVCGSLRVQTREPCSARGRCGWRARTPCIGSTSKAGLSIGSALHDDSHTSWPMPEMLGWVVERRDRQGFIAGFKSGFARLFLDPLRIEPICCSGSAPARQPHERRRGRSGRSHLGGHDGRPRASGDRLPLSPRCRGQLQQARHGLRREQRPDVQPRSRHAVSHGHDATRDLSVSACRRRQSRQARGVRRVSATDWGLPDGMATDVQGGIWVAHWGGGSSQPVSARRPPRARDPHAGLASHELLFRGRRARADVRDHGVYRTRGENLAGCLFEVAPGVRGAPTYAYGG